ncbi:hypothetical protein [Nonomuraea sp. NPDC049400]|uniref:hypothetical protein n=1 Tax=Nonomuraea sp. NPDC049400 TaxID=3364352 RepID=UPI00379E5CA5
MVHGTCVATWDEFAMPEAGMCSAWNRLLAEPPDTDIYQRLAEVVPPGTRWHAWPIHAVLEGWLAYAEAALAPVDFVHLLGKDVAPGVEGLCQVIETRSLSLEVVVGPSVPQDPPGTIRVRLARTKALGKLWDLGALADAYNTTLPAPLAAQQCSGLEFYADHPVAHFAHHPEELAMVVWAVLGLITGDTPGHVAMEIAATTSYIDRHSLRHAFVF